MPSKPCLGHASIILFMKSTTINTSKQGTSTCACHVCSPSNLSSAWIYQLPTRCLFPPSLSSPCLAVFTLEVCACPYSPPRLVLTAVVMTELPPDTRSDDVSKFFDGYGKIVDCRVMTGQLCGLTYFTTRTPKNMLGFGFVEFENARVRITFIHHCPPIELPIGRRRRIT